MADRGWTAESARARGGSRNFKLWVPATLDKGRAAPLVLLLHGCKHQIAAETAEISGMNEIADANGFLVAYPEQSRRANLLKCWNWFDPNTRRAMPVNRRFSPRSSIRFVPLTMLILIGSTLQAFRPGVLWLAFLPPPIRIFSQLWPFLRGAEFKAAISMSEGLAAMKRGGRIRSGKGSLRLKQCVPASAERISATCR